MSTRSELADAVIALVEAGSTNAAIRALIEGWPSEDDKRRTYDREYKRRKRAEAKAA